MSEGPEVKITAEKLCKAICGKTIDKVYSKTTIGNEFANKIRESDVRCVETYTTFTVILLLSFVTGGVIKNFEFIIKPYKYHDDDNYKNCVSCIKRKK